MTSQLRTITTVRTATAPDTDVTAFTPAPEQRPDLSPGTKTLRVLHVEDNPADALLMQEYLHGVVPDLHFDTATRLAELTPDRAAAADCALLDLSLPDASGLEAVIALRQMSDNIPIIVLTGFDNLELGLSAVRDGADDYLLKSHVDGYSLERAIQYAIERRRLLFEVANSNFTAESARAAAQQALAEAAATASDKASEDKPVHDKATGTHEVSVRIDAKTGDYVLECADCAWQADRGTDDLHSWKDRSLDVVLLHHVGYDHLPKNVAPAPAPSVAPMPALARRGVFNPRRWLAASTGDPQE